MRLFRMALFALTFSVIMVGTLKYWSTDSRGVGVVHSTFTEGKTYYVKTADGDVYMLMLGKPQQDKLKPGMIVNFRYRGYKVYFGPFLIMPPQIYYIVQAKPLAK